MMLVETVIGSSYLLKSEEEMSLSAKRYLTRLEVIEGVLLEVVELFGGVGWKCEGRSSDDLAASA